MQGTGLAWDDVRLFLALARARKLGPAAKLLALDASTLSRRLAALEQRCGLRLFERTRDGLVLTAAGERLTLPAQETEESVLRFFEQVRPREQEVAGTVRISAPPGAIELFLVPAAAELARRHPKLRFELDGNEAIASLLRREADIAMRLTRPTGEGLVIRRVGPSPNAIFASKELAHSLGQLDSFDVPPWVTWDAAHAQLPTARWFAENVSIEPVVRTSTVQAQIACAEASLGVAFLPVLSAEKRGLARVKWSRRIASTAAIPADDVYLACHAALRDVPRIKVVWAFLLELMKQSDPAARRLR